MSLFILKMFQKVVLSVVIEKEKNEYTRDRRLKG